jgi:hypothetical protein
MQTRKSTLDTFKESLTQDNPPGNFSAHATALWYAGKGNWGKAHDIVQDLPDEDASRIHAFLHRQEGDISNAKYWYAKAGSKMPASSLDEEWENLVKRSIGASI